MVYVCRALPGVTAAAIGLIVAAVFQLGLKVHANSPFPAATVSIGRWLCCYAWQQIYQGNTASLCLKCLNCNHGMAILHM